MIDWITPPRIQFRHIALFLLVAIVGGFVVGGIAAIPTYGFTHSQFLTPAIFAISFDGVVIVSYRWIAQKQSWVDLRTRFTPVAGQKLLLGAAGGFVLVALMMSAVLLLKWAGVKINPVASPDILPSGWGQMPLALLLACIVAPFTEELVFRGLLLDWLRQKLNVWIAALILSVLFSLLHNNPFSSGAIGWLAFGDRLLLGWAPPLWR